MKSKLQATMMIVALSFLAAGCGGGGGGRDGAGDDVPRGAIQGAAATSDAIKEIKKAAIGALAEYITNGAADGQEVPEDLVITNLENPADPDEEFNDYNLLINFDGEPDLYPNLHGSIQIHVEQEEFNNPPPPAEGNASYKINVLVIGDVVYTDPNTGAGATLSAGSTLSVDLDLTWTIGESTYVLTVESAIEAALSFSVTSQGVTWLATANGTSEAIQIITVTGAVATVESDLAVDLHIHLTGPQEYHIHIVVDDGMITVTVNGHQFGPYTYAEAAEKLGIPAP